ncbi:MAG: Uma2 family endonuclease [Bryobacteraceae bacterium]|jgi:Uma2 family endonuclease
MATTTQIALNEYLQATYHPDREYVAGELQERNVGKTDHARVQALLAALFVNHEQDWQIFVTTEQRIQVSADRVRIPDVTLVRPGGLSEDVLSTPPLCVIEILSPDDTISRTWEKAQDYRRMGIENIWLIDPGVRSGQASTANGWRDTLEFEIPGTPVRLSLAEVFRSLDQSRMA